MRKLLVLTAVTAGLALGAVWNATAEAG